MIKRVLIVTATVATLSLGFTPIAGAATSVPSVSTPAGTGLVVGTDMYHHA